MITKLFNSNLSGIIFVFCTHFHIRISTLVGFFLENYSVSQSTLLCSVCLAHDSSIKKNNDSTRALLSLTYHRRPINPMSYNRIVYIFVSSQERLTTDWDFLTGRPFRQCSDLHVSWGRQGGPIPTTRVWGQVPANPCPKTCPVLCSSEVPGPKTWPDLGRPLELSHVILVGDHGYHD
jgi:hypothetical protein